MNYLYSLFVVRKCTPQIPIPTHIIYIYNPLAMRRERKRLNRRYQLFFCWVTFGFFYTNLNLLKLFLNPFSQMKKKYTSLFGTYFMKFTMYTINKFHGAITQFSLVECRVEFKRFCQISSLYRCTLHTHIRAYTHKHIYMYANKQSENEHLAEL